jgi:hypothetical protein
MMQNLNKERHRCATPPLYVPDQKSGPDHREKNPGEDRPDDAANEPKELYEEDAPDLA